MLTQCVNVSIAIQGGPKTRLFFLELITLRWLMKERHVTSKVAESVLEKKHETCMSVHLNILCLVCINIIFITPEIMLNVIKMHRF